MQRNFSADLDGERGVNVGTLQNALSDSRPAFCGSPGVEPQDIRPDPVGFLSLRFIPGPYRATEPEAVNQ